MAALTVNSVIRAGLTTPTLATPAGGGDTFVNDGNTFVWAKNTNGATRTITFGAVINCNQGFDHDLAVILPASTGDVMIGPFPKSQYGTPVAMSYTAVTGVTLTVIKVP